ncbi:alpha/beta fold hydrolase [Halomonas sp. SpR8]|uniref:alpha/beta fold hydrolase n=1 Tax=Halomonas sp. SpR8 TaxID=3050463 RepID=UPI0027E43B56|nr:alpha/beta fold hydrolase [Halomonas sp. SpR8]MDQ7728252.1 alpha/beta fold hydrolase [Halomonas sp. SpR8]
MELTNSRKSPDGTRYWRQGSGPPVVLIHGVGLDATMWQSQIDVLAEQYEIIVYDMLGHGDSALPNENDGLDAYADQLALLLDHLAIKRVAVVGFSMGGLVARAFALSHPDRIAAMVVLSSVFDRDESQRASVRHRIVQTRDQGPAANVGDALKRWFSPEFHHTHPDCINAIYETVINNNPQGYYRSYALFGTQDNFGTEQLHTIQMPVMVATGELDTGSTPRMASALAQKLPNAELHILPGLRHMAPIEAPQAVNGLIKSFFAKAYFHDSLEEAHQ